MLLQLLDTLKQEGVASVKRLSTMLGMDESAIEPMLALWEDKGVIRAISATMACRNPCQKGCPSVFYEVVS